MNYNPPYTLPKEHVTLLRTYLRKLEQVSNKKQVIRKMKDLLGQGELRVTNVVATKMTSLLLEFRKDKGKEAKNVVNLFSEFFKV